LPGWRGEVPGEGRDRGGVPHLEAGRALGHPLRAGLCPRARTDLEMHSTTRVVEAGAAVGVPPGRERCRSPADATLGGHGAPRTRRGKVSSRRWARLLQHFLAPRRQKRGRPAAPRRRRWKMRLLGPTESGEALDPRSTSSASASCSPSALATTGARASCPEHGAGSVPRLKRALRPRHTRATHPIVDQTTAGTGRGLPFGRAR